MAIVAIRNLIHTQMLPVNIDYFKKAMNIIKYSFFHFYRFVFTSLAKRRAIGGFFILVFLLITFRTCPSTILFLKGFSILTGKQASAASSDAIAIRVIPNQEHYGAFTWYGKQGFKGSPQSIIIDGYEAVRDGRTVYVNAANISGANLYSNIYLISYNQNAEPVTIDIFGRILEHWKFNSNIIDVGQCRLDSLKSCLDNSDCGEADYCLSQKSKIIRDVKRLADIVEMKPVFDGYKVQNGFMPKLTSGTYLVGKTLSVWPSWSQTLSEEMGSNNLPIDPINKLGDCGDNRFNSVTCWDENSKEFAGEIPSSLPTDSRVYVYQFIDDDNYTLCADLETDYGNINSFDCL